MCRGLILASYVEITVKPLKTFVSPPPLTIRDGCRLDQWFLRQRTAGPVTVLVGAFLALYIEQTFCRGMSVQGENQK